MDDNNTLASVDRLSAEIDNTIMMLSMISADDTDRVAYLDEFITGLEQVATEANAVGYSAIADTCQWCQHNLAFFKENKSQQVDVFIKSGECWQWLELMSAYLVDPTETSYVTALNSELLRDEWLYAYKAEDLQALLLQLKSLSLSCDTDTESDDVNEQHEAEHQSNEQSTTDALTFTWDDDTHPEFLDAFFEETTELIGELSTLLIKVANGELDSDRRYHASRVAHTIKGGSAVAGITSLSTLSYRLEKILDYSVKNELAADIYPLLAETSPCLERLFQAILELTGEPKGFARIFNRLSDYAETLEEDTAPLELGTPKLPDFITQKATSATSSENETDAVNDDVSHTDDDNNADREVTTQAEHQEVVVEVVETVEVIESAAEENVDENDFAQEINTIIATLSALSHDNAHSDKYIDTLKAFASLADSAGYTEVAHVSQWVQRNLVYFDANQLDKSAFIDSGECWLWLKNIHTIVSYPEDPSHLAALTTELMRDDWAIPFAVNDLQNVLIQLKERQNTDNADISTAENDSSNGNDIDSYQFSWDDDIHPDLLSSYLTETPDQVAQVASLLHKIAKGEASKADYQHASRIAHTIKGASGVLGITALVAFTHKLEDILDHSIHHALPQAISALLADSADCLEDLFDAILHKEAAPDEFAPLLAQLTQYSETLAQQDSDSVDSANSTFTSLLDELSTEALDTPEPQQQTQPIEKDKHVAATTTNTTPEKINTLPIDTFQHQEPDFSALVSASESEAIKPAIEAQNKQDITTADSYIRVPVNIIDMLFTLVGELVTTSIQVTDKLDKSITTSKQVKEQDVRVHKMLDELSSTLLKQEKEQFKIIASLQQDSGFDHLEMDTYNELHSINGLLTESILDSEAIEDKLEKQLYELKDSLHTLDLLNKDLSDVILKSRMVSINSLIPRLERIVRQTSNKTKKKAELLVTGNDIDVDTDILNGLTDPLLHLLRNAIDHGIEYPMDREARNKNKTGQINLAFARKGSHIQMQLKDDGAGMDAEKIYQQALNKGLVAADKKLSRDEKLQLILTAGFSTQDKVTDISGRGVGMDVVNNAVRELDGTLTIDSEVGKGTTFTISIPLTLVTSRTLLVNVSGNQIAVPAESIEQLYYLTPDHVIKNERGYFVEYDGRELPIQSLATLIGFSANTPDFSQAHTLLFVKSINETHAIYIDEVISSRQTVIKSLSDWLDSSQGLIGACHLPDGGVAPVINLPKILSLNEQTNQLIQQIQLDADEQTAVENIAKILVVDDSLSNRKALSLIIEQTEFEVMTAVDGLDALQMMNENQIDLVFTDLEMPRMNGVELTQAIRVWEDKKDTPVVMITSRTTSKHRKLAEKAGVDDYLTKPVMTETLLNSISQWLEQAAA